MKLELLPKKSWGRAMFRTLEPVTSGVWVIPEGFETDLASVPRFAWWFVNPVDPDVAPCAVVHDYLCRQAQYSATGWKERKYADQTFYRCLRKRGVKIRAPFMYLAVRIGALLAKLRGRI